MTDIKPMGVLLILAAILAVAFVIVRTLWRALLDSNAGGMKARMETLLAARPDFKADHVAYSVTSTSFIAIDERSMQVLRYYVSGTEVFQSIFPIGQIRAIQLSVDEVTSFTGVTAGQFGDASLLAATKIFQHQDCKSIALQFHLNYTNMPVTTHFFLSSAVHGKFEAGSNYVKEAISDATRIKAVVEMLIGAPSRNLPISVADQLPKLGDLPSRGHLTDTESQSQTASRTQSAQGSVHEKKATPDLRARLRAITAVQQKVDQSEIHDTDTFAGRNGDSLDAIELLMAAEDEFRITLQEDELRQAKYAHYTFDNWAEYLAQRSG